MITNIIKTLQLGDFYGESDTIEIAKGKREHITTFKELKRKAVRLWQSKKK